MWSSGFFNSVNGDRTYNADQMSKIFEGLITDGVYESVGNKLAVQPNSDMTIQISSGRGWFNGRWVNNDSEYLLTLDAADVLLKRYCAVCIRVDTSDSGRTATPYLKYSDFATTPVKPTMERSETVKEYCLAYIYIDAGVTSITASAIEDTRGNNNLCGWVTGLIEQVTTTTLFNQYETLFNELYRDTKLSLDDWINSLADYLDENVEAKLTADITNLKNTMPFKSIGTFDGLGWNSHDDGTYTQTITVEGVTSDNDIFVSPTDEYKEAYINMNCEATSQAENSITFTCTDPVDVNIQVAVIIFP